MHPCIGPCTWQCISGKKKRKGYAWAHMLFPQRNMDSAIGCPAHTCSELSNVLPGLPMHFLKHLSVILCNERQMALGMHGIILVC